MAPENTPTDETSPQEQPEAPSAAPSAESSGAALADAGRQHNRHVLLLQGPSSPFMTHLGAALRAQGARVSRIHLCPGDWVMWRGQGGQVFREPVEAWAGYVSAFARQAGVTDLVCLGSARRYHQDAIAALRPMGVRTTVIEQGYLRPGYLLAEPEGGGGESHFPRLRAEVEALAAADLPLPTPLDPAREGSFARRAALDWLWNMSNVVLAPLVTPGYRRHALDHPVREYFGWLRKFALHRSRQKAAAEAEAAIRGASGPVFLFPLQLETDFQVRRYGTGWSLREELEQIIVSFSAHAPPEARLVVKVHPLDNGWVPWRKRIASMAWRQAVDARVIFIDGGDLDAILAVTRGVITINSTVGLTALLRGIPVLALGDAVYDLPGLTHQGDVADFWRKPEQPDADFAEALRLAMLKTVHVAGCFDGPGMAEGAEGIAAKVLSPAPFGPFATGDART